MSTTFLSRFTNRLFSWSIVQESHMVQYSCGVRPRKVDFATVACSDRHRVANVARHTGQVRQIDAAARSVGDEPAIFPQLIRIACLAQTLAVNCESSGHGRMANPEEMAEATVWLCSEKAST